MLRKMGKPDTLRVLYLTDPYVRAVETSVVQMDSPGFVFGVTSGSRRVPESKGVDLWTVYQTIEYMVGASQCPLGAF